MAGNVSSEIYQHAKEARDFALVGNYDHALLYYDNVLKMLDNMIATLHDPARKTKWTVVSIGTLVIINR